MQSAADRAKTGCEIAKDAPAADRGRTRPITLGRVRVGRGWRRGAAGLAAAAVLAVLIWPEPTAPVTASSRRITLPVIAGPEGYPANGDLTEHGSGQQAGENDAARLLYATMIWRSYRHPTNGIVEVYRLTGGRRLLRLADLATAAGPDLAVWLSALPYTAGGVEAGATNLGPLRGHRAGANYPIPDGTDLTKAASVVIADRGNVPIAAAPLRVTGR